MEDGDIQSGQSSIDTIHDQAARTCELRGKRRCDYCSEIDVRYVKALSTLQKCLYGEVLALQVSQTRSLTEIDTQQESRQKEELLERLRAIQESESRLLSEVTGYPVATYFTILTTASGSLGVLLNLPFAASFAVASILFLLFSFFSAALVASDVFPGPLFVKRSLMELESMLKIETLQHGLSGIIDQ